jgi:hypothetical protein
VFFEPGAALKPNRIGRHRVKMFFYAFRPFLPDILSRFAGVAKTGATLVRETGVARATL